VYMSGPGWTARNFISSDLLLYRTARMKPAKTNRDGAGLARWLSMTSRWMRGWILTEQKVRFNHLREKARNQAPRRPFRIWLFPGSVAYYETMLPAERTPRQRILELLTGTRLSAYQLAQLLAISERQVEAHLPHVVKTVARDNARTFILEPASCSGCGFTFGDRTRLTKPSRCPHCRSEHITDPRFGIDVASLQTREASR